MPRAASLVKPRSALNLALAITTSTQVASLKHVASSTQPLMQAFVRRAPAQRTLQTNLHRAAQPTSHTSQRRLHYAAVAPMCRTLRPAYLNITRHHAVASALAQRSGVTPRDGARRLRAAPRPPAQLERQTACVVRPPQTRQCSNADARSRPTRAHALRKHRAQQAQPTHAHAAAT